MHTSLMQNDDEDRQLGLECPSCGLRGIVYVSPAGELDEIPEGFQATLDFGTEHKFSCRKCSVDAKLVS